MKCHGSTTGENLEDKRFRERRLFSMLPTTKTFSASDYAAVNGLTLHNARKCLQELAQVGLIVFKHQRWRKTKQEQ